MCLDNYSKDEAIKESLDHIVVIEVSAGAPRALQQLFTQLSSVGNHACVLAIHQAINQCRHLADLVGRSAKLNIKTAQKKSPLEQGTMLIMTPCYIDKNDGSWVLLTDKKYCYSPTPSIEILFECLAQYWGERAVAVVRSGTRSHGTRSFRAVKANGGIVLGQSPERAQFNATPRAVIPQGYRDLVADQATLGIQIDRLSCQRANEYVVGYSKSISLLLRTGLENVRRSIEIDLARHKDTSKFTRFASL